MSRDWTQDEFGITEDTPVSNSEKEINLLKEKLDIAVMAIKTVIKEEGDNIDGGLLMFLTEALEKIKEIK